MTHVQFKLGLSAILYNILTISISLIIDILVNGLL